MPPYTKEEHAKNLLKLLELKDPWRNCPVLDRYAKESVCFVCRSFIGAYFHLARCPCNLLGPEKAIKLTWLALEREGYLD